MGEVALDFSKFVKRFEQAKAKVLYKFTFLQTGLGKLALSQILEGTLTQLKTFVLCWETKVYAILTEQSVFGLLIFNNLKPDWFCTL